ncbi:hypothetical protein L336_0139 [Candidatus Saccharimonas aalborgensis]|uniref:Uncharacterized protein n=1 Tax=Candidatus Saccharimonas aalborgensis TaxID=1332188 RepID=R4PUM1_9BACT|nr:hypothetical protein L336_0134 [Candidatus Saccharimonas aalborgensis]AGL61850.1 hypothetical protein L336_0139 [Candidatus Saccharimonas aalborgensis]
MRSARSLKMRNINYLRGRGFGHYNSNIKIVSSQVTLDSVSSPPPTDSWP